MELNITLFVQMLNFFIAWLLLHQLYFKPAIAFLEQQQKEQDHLLEAVRRWQIIAAQKEHEIDALWNRLKTFSGQHRIDSTNPDLFVFKYTLPSIEAPLLQQKDVDAVIRRIKETVVQGVTYEL